MGKIFGISNNPVSTIDSDLRPVSLKPPVRNIKIINIHSKDKAVMVEPVINRANEANYFIKMRNGFGKLMSHFSKVNKAAKK